MYVKNTRYEQNYKDDVNLFWFIVCIQNIHFNLN